MRPSALHRTRRRAFLALLALPCAVLLGGVPPHFAPLSLCLSAPPSPPPARPTPDPPKAPLPPPPARDAADDDSFDRLVTAIVLSHLPRKFDDDDHWGLRKEIYSGLDISIHGLEIRTKRRRKRVNHGNWRRYEIELVNPEDRFQVELRNVRDLGSGRTGFDAVVSARLKAHGRSQRWERGLRIYSLTVDAVADVRLHLRWEVGTRLDAAGFPPDVLIEPQVTDAKLHLVGYRVNRISHIRGSVARELGRSLRDVVERKIHDSEDKLVTKANREIADHADDLRLPLSKYAASGWNRVQQLLGTDANNADKDDPPAADHPAPK